MAITAASANSNSVTMGGAGANAFVTWCGGTNHTVTVTPGGAAVFIAPGLAGFAVSSNGLLKVTNSGTNSASYVLYIGGSE